MPEDVVEQEQQGEGDGAGADQPTKSARDRGPLKLIGATIGVAVLGAALALMAVPSKPDVEHLEGPHAFQILPSYQANPIDGNLTRFIKFTPHCEYYAYDADYLKTRASDPFYLPRLKTALGRAVANKTLAEILEGIQRELFPVEVEQHIAPVLFPPHVGDTRFPLDRDEESGLGPGFSFEESTFRGLFFEHELALDAKARTIRIDDGPIVTYAGDERDLLVTTSAGETLYLDVIAVVPDFEGTIHVGVRGRIRKVMILEPIAQ